MSFQGGGRNSSSTLAAFVENFDRHASVTISHANACGVNIVASNTITFGMTKRASFKIFSLDVLLINEYFLVKIKKTC
jgi:hypothetical protein